MLKLDRRSVDPSKDQGLFIDKGYGVDIKPS